MPIIRYLSKDKLDRLKNDFSFLIKKDGILEKYSGEIDIYLRNGYFNIYYKGNSLAKVTFSPKDTYRVSINKRFFYSTDLNPPFTKASKDNRIIKCIVPSKNPNAKYENFLLQNNLLHPLFQWKYINEFCSNIKKVHNSEELIFEQMIITDNITDDTAEKAIIIDRQITETGMSERMDLLALKPLGDNQYYFSVIEVKLGNNEDLKGKVVTQIDGYVNRIISRFTDYKTCYEKVYQQKRELGLVGWRNLPQKITIVKNPECVVEGKIVIFGYSGIAKAYMKNLKCAYPIDQITYKV
ncbi:MAG TPA: hypothetical protein PLK94_07485 [Alphaproteobacteria bacterium]|nr:hypothetical protein [Alphaproteobacteria bacterium]